MTSPLEIAVASASTITRLSALTFLRWIPGHHFPPIIVAATALYLTLIGLYSKSFGTGRPSLRKAFPKLFRNKQEERPRIAANVDDTDHDEPALYHEERTILKTLFLGIPDWHEWEYSYITIALNILATILSLDLVFRGPVLYDGKDLKFSRVGYVDHNSAKILVRDPDASNLPIYAYVKPLHYPDWITFDSIYRMTDETDFTRPVEATGLKPDTAYVYALSNDLNGTFHTAPAPGTQKAKSLTFLTSSCIKANFPYNPFSHSLAIHGFRYVSQVLKEITTTPSFMLFLGDFIYVDVPLRLSKTQEHYRSEYRRVYASPSWNLPGLRLPWLHTLDDHEIANDWAGGNETEPFPAASDPFMHYHVSVNPLSPPNAPSGSSNNATYFQFVQGPASFFMLDTRRYRTRPEPSEGVLGNSSKPLYGSSSTVPQEAEQTPTMLGDTQLRSLLSFLATPETSGVHWKIITSSVPFTKNWRFGTSDTWGGFATERKRILQAMHFAEEHLGVRVVVLSGDRHEFAAIRFPAPGTNERAENVETNGSGPHEFSVGPLSMFYLPIRTFKQIDNEDIAIAYFPDGNSKIGAIDISPSSHAASREPSSTLRYTLWIDGKRYWEYSLQSPRKSHLKRSNLHSWAFKPML